MTALVPGVSPCPALVGDNACGLLWRHGGEHLPWRLVPGAYLPPPMLSPLYLLLLRMNRRCPLCGAPISRLDGEWIKAMRGNVTN